ncbi:MAG: class I adenylate-forming enzyme family protein [Deltaproteobacteria bacterium]
MSSGPNPPVSLLVIETGASATMPGVAGPLLPDWPACDRHAGRLLCAVGACQPGRPAVTTAAGEWTYGRLISAVRAVASRLAGHSNFHRGGRVVLLLPNSPEYVAVFYGVLLAGGVIVPLPPKTEAGVLQKIIESTEATVIVTRANVVQSRADLNGLPAEVLDLAPISPVGPPQATSFDETTGDELAAIFFTAGSTGIPKGVMLSHGNLISNARAIQGYLPIGREDRPLCVLPFHHAFGNSVLQSHLLAGANLVLDGQTTFPETIIKSLHRHECTSFSAVPDLFRSLLERSSLGQTGLPSVRYMAVAGGALRHELALEVARRIAPAEFFVMYGQTEATARLAFVPPRHLAELPAGTIGRAIPGVTLDVVDEEGVPVAAGEIGELRAKGPGLMLGYWRDPVATDERIRDGWLYTGDLATRDSQGWFIHRGRRNALVKIAGFRVHPADLEDFAIRRLPVSQAAAVAFESPDVGTRLALYVKPAESGTDLAVSEMVARCRNELPRHLVPNFIQIVDELPLNHALKIDRPLLTKLAEQETARRRALA